MKIAIYGDSFGDIKKYEPYAKDNIKFQQRIQNSWPALLADKYNIDNFSKSSTGLEWSYNLAINNTVEYDKVIFLASHVDRLMVNSEWSNDTKLKHLNQAATADSKDPLENKILKTAQKYYAYFQNREFSHNRAALMYNDLKQRFGDKILLLRIFPDGLGHQGTYNCDNQLLLADIQVNEITQRYGRINSSQMSKKLLRPDRRICHITKPHHDMMFTKIDNWIQTKEFSLTQQDLITINKQELAKYFDD